VLVFPGIVRQGGPSEGSVMSFGAIELFVGVAMAGLAAMALGLLISAFVSNADKALTILPVVLFAQFLFTGSAFPVSNTPGLAQASYFASAKWGFSAAAVDRESGRSAGDRVQRFRVAVRAGREVRRDAAHKAGVWIGDLAALGALGAACIAGAWLPSGRSGSRGGSRSRVTGRVRGAIGDG